MMDGSNGSNGSSSPEQMSDDKGPDSPKQKQGAEKEKLSVNANGRPVKRRASKACQSCRQRKVRCNVVEHGAPCTNCRLDQVNCVLTESKRRKKHNLAANQRPLDAINEQLRLPQQSSHDHQDHSNHAHTQPHPFAMPSAEALRTGSINPLDLQNSSMHSADLSGHSFRRHSNSSESIQDEEMNHVPHLLYANQQRLSFHEPTFVRGASLARPLEPIDVSTITHDALLNSASIHGDLRATRLQTPPAPPARTTATLLPAYLKPLPQRMAADDVQYLYRKGALTLPPVEFRNELLRCFVEYVYPYMPLLELQEFLRIINKGTGEDGRVSLILLQAVLFTGVAFIDMEHLRRAGFQTRKAARKTFYTKTRLLYDFDYEQDRVALVQSLLLMTYWYETPDDQKDTWHWMGVAISLAHTIGLHRNPVRSLMDKKKKKLWKRIWWSCFMRDRLVALGMRRPTRIKQEDYDVPMLEMSDFEIDLLPADNTVIPRNCRVVRDLELQTDLAILCIAKAKLAICISHVLSSQYSVLVRDNRDDNNTRSSVMLVPKKMDLTEEVRKCGQELLDWKASLGEKYKHKTPTAADLDNGRTSWVVQKALLQMIYWATVSALHRPQVLPAAETVAGERLLELRDESRQHVRNASRTITQIASDLHQLRLERYLPTTGVTVLLPAIIIHLLDIKSSIEATRLAALDGFCQCMLVLEQLRENYPAADFATQFLEAAIRKAQIDVGMDAETDKPGMVGPGDGIGLKTLPPRRVADNVSQLLEYNKGRTGVTTPPPDFSKEQPHFGIIQNVERVYEHATTPPESETSNGIKANNPTISRDVLGYQFSLSIPTSDDANDQTDLRKDESQVPLTNTQQGGLLPMNDDLIDWSACAPSNVASALQSGQPTAMDEQVDFDWNNLMTDDGSFEKAMQSMDAHGETGGFAFNDIVHSSADWQNGDDTWHPDGMEGIMSFGN